MRDPFLPPPTVEELGRLRIHEALRDYPELLPWMLEQEIPVTHGAGGPIPTAVLQRGATDLNVLLAWREKSTS